MITQSLKNYIETDILPLYDSFDAAHQRNHVEMVIEQSKTIATDLDVNMDMAYTIAAYHDTGLTADRKSHHLVSGKIVREDMRLRHWFREEQIEVMAQACEDHRASSDHEPRSIYGKIVAEADRFIDPDTIILRTVQYGLANYPELDKEGHWLRTLKHLHEKYAEGGYLRLWFDNSPNVVRLNALREIITNEPLLLNKFNIQYESLTNPPSRRFR
ncbi:HD domain-containing protein [uncultured Muribaculum sp.]|uniref:HD domain-containing protein n=1 Tax=uncultured Muribaculum sp. TaxID=1918613 RepID=UPI0025997EE6|nr:HD domain-containing protein [uncultured Muribaculum sp.]